MWRRMCLEVERLIRTAGLRAGEGRRDRAVGSTRGGRGPSRSRSRPRRGAVIDRWGLIASPPWPGAPPRSGLRPDGLDGADHRSRVHTLSPAPLNHQCRKRIAPMIRHGDVSTVIVRPGLNPPGQGRSGGTSAPVLEAGALVLRLVPNLVLFLNAVLEYFIHR